MYGGSEEIIQICLEHGLECNSDAILAQSISGYQNTVFEWLISVHQIEPTKKDLALAFGRANWYAFTRLYEILALDANFTKRCDVKGVLDYATRDCMTYFTPMRIMSQNDMALTFALMYADPIDFAMKCRSIPLSARAIYFAAKLNRTSILRHVDNFIGLNRSDTQGRTALHIAVLEGHLPAIECLIDAGVNVNQQNQMCQTPLMLAAMCGHEDTVGLLLIKGAWRYGHDECHTTAYQYADMFGFEIAKHYLSEDSKNVSTNDTTLDWGQKLQPKTPETFRNKYRQRWTGISWY